MSKVRLLDIADRLKEDKSYRDIAKELMVSPREISEAKNLIGSKVIEYDAETGKAFFSKAAEAEIESIHREVTEVVTKKATEVALKNAEEDYLIGNEIRQYWSLKANDAGVGLREYVRGALVFFEEYKDKIEEIDELKVVNMSLAEGLKKNMVEIAKMDYYYKFARYCLYMKSQGLEVPSQVVERFWSDLNILVQVRREVGQVVIR